MLLIPTGQTGVDGQIAALEQRLRAQEIEIAGQKLHAARDGASSPQQFAEIMDNQTKLLKAVLGKPKAPGSIIKS